MATIRKILLWPDPALRQKSEPVAEVNDEIRALVEDLFATMYASQGAGLAAIQVGVPKQVLVIDVRSTGEGEGKYALINPVIEEKLDKQRFREGCLSIPGYVEDIERAEEITVRYLDVHGAEHRSVFTGLEAVAIQHEVDHLSGVLFVDYLSNLKKDIARKKVEKAKKLYARMVERARALSASKSAEGTERVPNFEDIYGRK